MTAELVLPVGFRAAGIHCGIKSDPEKLDLSLLVSDCPAIAAGVYTTNRVCGAPISVCRERLPSSAARAVLINSGNANACTGERGIDDARTSTQAVASELACEATDVLMLSTGVIGRLLPMEKLTAGIPKLTAELSFSTEGFHRAARGMMTTDTVTKQSVRRLRIGEKSVTVSGVAKGAAMIAPNMATMLAVVMTDATLTPDEAERILRASVERTFNRISIDGHTSTSDAVLLMANGASGVDASNEPAGQAIATAIAEVCGDLSKSIVRDAEGATHFVTVDVRGLPTEDDAVRVARAVADSPLVKTAIAGADPNWGRVVSAAGYSGIEFEERELSLELNGVSVYRDGVPQAFDARAVSKSMRENRDLSLVLTFSRGNAFACMHTCDLTAEYVRLNADYTT
ncbi:MAG: bifunctional glutamate N-acetyltransferase/amino-acid acetyltransferase ArgJ [Blastocatellia bacterium]|nr:bifunctional glutamate N-acetyltransferase/amino-acid acetyltransferase ArgJ [Blastocatellia bacterium]